MSLTVLLGGARSGKSALAVRTAVRTGRPVVWIATGEPRDEEFAARIEAHRASRPTEWTTIEEPVDLDAALGKVPDDACAVVDCLTLWVSNLIERDLDDAAIAQRASDTAAIAAARRVPTIAVTNEVGLGIVPANALARRYRDVLGRTNAAWVAAASRSSLVVAGRAIELTEADVDG